MNELIEQRKESRLTKRYAWLCSISFTISYGISFVWEFFDSPYKNGYRSLGEFLFVGTQCIAELCFVLSLSYFFRKMNGFYVFFVFVVDAAIIDCVHKIFFNPFDDATPFGKFIAGGICFLYSLFKFYKLYKKKK